MENVYANPSTTFQSVPQHQFVTVQATETPGAVPAQTLVPVAPALPTAEATRVPAKSNLASQTMSAGLLGMIVVSTGAMGANLNRVTVGEMTMGQAVGDSVAKGVTGGVAAASATAASATLTSGGAAGLAVTLATATGVSFLINRYLP